MSLKNSTELANSLSEERIRELLKPLQQEENSVDYLHQYKAIKEFSWRLHSLESSFAAIYTQISHLEQEMVKQKLKYNPNQATT